MATAAQWPKPDDWREHRVVIFRGQADTRIKTGNDYDSVPMRELFGMAPGDKPKGKGLAFIPSIYCGHDARSHAVQREHGVFVALVGDIDKGDHALAKVKAAVDQFAPGCAFRIHASAHARPGNMRWRILLPLAEPLGFAEWHDAQTVFFDAMEAAGLQMDRALDRAGQPVYLPNVPPVHAESGELLRDADGRPLYFQSIANASLPGLSIDQGPIADALAALAIKRAADDKLREAIRAQAEARRQSRAAENNGGQSVIDTFNATASLPDLLEGYGYTQSPVSRDDWRSPHQESASYATRIIGNKWVSLSASDAAARVGAGCASGCYGDAFDLFVHYGHGGDRSAAWRQVCNEQGRSQREAPRWDFVEHQAPEPDAASYKDLQSQARHDDGSDQDAQPEAKARAKKPKWHTVPNEIGGKPVIQMIAGNLHHMATQGEAALVAAKAPLYSRGEQIVRPIVDDMPASRGRVTKVPRLRVVDKDTLVDHLSRVSAWVKFDGRSKDFVVIDPPVNAAMTILSRDGEWRFRRLAGVITTPTLRPDGTILSQAGYDEATQLLLLDPPAMPAIPAKPSRADALASLALLDGLLDEFPFVDETSRAVALSALITPVVRGAMAVAPMHATTAPVAGSGKSYIIDLASAISVGQRAPVISAGAKEEETEKRLGAALLNGQPIVSIDNVNGELGGDALCQMIERPVVSVRPLGVSKLVKIESRATCFATGNNIRLIGDMTRRVVVCTLDPNMERPELREFAGSPFDTVIAERGKYIAAALTVARAYIVAGRPGKLLALASFDEWSDIVRSALVWLGRNDPVASMEAARADDPVISTLRILYAAWFDATGSTAVTTAAIKDKANTRNTFSNYVHSELQQVLETIAGDGRGDINSQRLAKFLGRHQGRIVDGFKLQVEKDSHAKQNVWKVVKVAC